MMTKVRLVVGLLVLCCTIAAHAQTAAESGILHGGSAAQPQSLGVIPQVPAAPSQAAATTPDPAAPQAAPAPDQGMAGQTTEEMPSGALPLHVTVNKSVLINTQDELKRVAVTDPGIADAVVVSLHQVMVHGRQPGEVTLILWDTAERSRSFDLMVDVDATAAAREINRVFPTQQIKVVAVRSALVLSGHVATDKDAERAGKIAEAFTKNVVNVLSAGPVGADEVMLEVKFAEVDRTALLQWGINIFSTGAANTAFGSSTQQFGGLSGVSSGAVTSDVNLRGSPPGSSLFTSEINNQLFHQPTVVGTNDLLNLFVFNTSVNLGAIIKALQQQNVLEILAEPNLIAVDGKDASFLAGGEFPFPVSQGISGAVTILWKEFGVRLKFLPAIMPNGRIHLRVQPEVSALDFNNALTISGFIVPALSTRRAETELELQDGQSFVIAGLMDHRVTNVMSKIPGIGSIPILGNLFKSKNVQKNKTELMVLVTVKRVSPTMQPPPLPNFPLPFMKDEGKKPGEHASVATPPAVMTSAEKTEKKD
jgi:pilus assembly protein CpaC